MKPTAQLILYTARVKQNGKFPVKLRVVFKREHKDFRLGIDLTESEFKEATSLKPKKQFRDISTSLTSYSNKANQIIGKLTSFTFNKFEREFYGNQKDVSDIFPIFQEYITKLEDEERVKTAQAYQTAMKTIKRFHSKSKLNILDITPAFLTKFGKWMIEQGNSPTTVGIYTRTLRAIYNYAIALGVINKDENYPFGRNKFIPPAGRNIKKALKLADIKKIYDYSPIPGTFEDRAKDFWLFSYFCNGINFKDICMLRRKNIDGDMIRFIREKTKRTSQGNQVMISCYVSENVKKIIDKWGNKDMKPDSFVFPILSEKDDVHLQAAKVAQFIQNTNKNMKRICANLGIDSVTTYHARHSSATVMKRAGASVEQIQELLGHSNTAVTQKYLDSFEDDSKKELAKALTNF